MKQHADSTTDPFPTAGWRVTRAGAGRADPARLDMTTGFGSPRGRLCRRHPGREEQSLI
jgi:hypothetical protein